MCNAAKQNEYYYTFDCDREDGQEMCFLVVGLKRVEGMEDL